MGKRYRGDTNKSVKIILNETPSGLHQPVESEDVDMMEPDGARSIENSNNYGESANKDSKFLNALHSPRPGGESPPLQMD